MILLIDNYDSFAHNLARYLRRLGQTTEVVRNDAIGESAIEQFRPQAIVLSPGPCGPAEAGNSMEIVRRWHRSIPMLGVCLGHQVIAAALGGEIVRAAEPMHGRTSPVQHDGERLFSGLPSPLTVCRYHSLVIEPRSLPDELRVCATTDQNTIMAIEHRSLLLFGVQFHPEAILTKHGFELLANFLSLAGCHDLPEPSHLAETEDRTLRPAPLVMPREPVTY